MMTVGEALRTGARRLRESGKEAPRLTAEILLAEAVRTSRYHVLAHPEVVVRPEGFELYQTMVERRCSGEPTAYILRRREFYGLELEVGPGVFVPRPETEHLVEWALEFLAGEARAGRMLDLCTGSGNVVAALLVARPELRAVAVDSSTVALSYASRNLQRLGVAPRARLVAGDMTHALRCPLGGFDLITANPPYVRGDEPGTISPEVRRHEPAEALFVPSADPWCFVRLLRQAALRLIRPHGLLLVEVGAGQARETQALLAADGLLRPEGLRCDLAGIERVVGVRVPGSRG
ncbi:MAG: peptide chain release factor N(5)-glutamine methyltransferase [Planctomycetota bacterium]